MGGEVCSMQCLAHTATDSHEARNRFRGGKDFRMGHQASRVSTHRRRDNESSL